MVRLSRKSHDAHARARWLALRRQAGARASVVTRRVNTTLVTFTLPRAGKKHDGYVADLSLSLVRNVCGYV